MVTGEGWTHSQAEAQVAYSLGVQDSSRTHEPSATSHSPAFTDGQRSYDGRLLALSLDLEAKDAEATFVIMEGDALDKAGDFLGDGFSFETCGIHSWPFIFPRMDCHESQSRNSRIVKMRDVLAKPKSKSQPAWTDVKAKLVGFDRPGLLALIQSLYALHKDNQRFLRARFGLGDDVLEPFKETIDRWLWPDVLRNQDTSVFRAKQAIAAYRKASGDREGLAELMVFYCERAAGFCSDIGNDDERYFDALVRMFEQALRLADTLPADSRDGLVARLERIRDTSHQFGYGEIMDSLLLKYVQR